MILFLEGAARPWWPLERSSCHEIKEAHHRYSLSLAGDGALDAKAREQGSSIYNIGRRCRADGVRACPLPLLDEHIVDFSIGLLEIAEEYRVPVFGRGLVPAANAIHCTNVFEVTAYGMCRPLPLSTATATDCLGARIQAAKSFWQTLSGPTTSLPMASDANIIPSRLDRHTTRGHQELGQEEAGAAQDRSCLQSRDHMHRSLGVQDIYWSSGTPISRTATVVVRVAESSTSSLRTTVSSTGRWR
ncbi:hypothetical protein C7974DRAFT_378766 [Boeremia exigua]|uniref:uncharacterized protein n=1 Tax=Boeremia exigua TaxID=749465 RepID=UPI001E8EABCF|nr:uncharacterized protein C7974DRAFT_378766 [Boeremia exigua]KAH6618583.1 hypothetical protein C7974DRAFT_378766 [Boeremia exigua]